MYQRILVPIDGSPTSEKALDAAIGLAKTFAGRLRLVYVLEDSLRMTGYDVYGGSPPSLYEELRNWGDQLLQQGLEKVRAAGVDVDAMLVDEAVGLRLGEAVADAAKRWNADLVVLGTHGRRGVARALLGSGAEQVIRLAPVPVLVVRSSVSTAMG